MKNILLTHLISIFLISITFSQEKVFTIKDVVTNSYYSLAAENLKQLEWLPKTNTYAFIEKEKNEDAIVLSNPFISSNRTVVTLSKFNSALSDMKMEKMNKFPKTTWIDKNHFLFWQNQFLLKYALSKQKITTLAELDKYVENKTISPNNSNIAYTIKNNLFVNLGEKQNIQISDEADSNIISGQSVHRNEFGIKGGIFWSPNSNFIAYYKMDQTMVASYPLVKMGTVPATVEWIKYPMAGQTSHQVKIAVYNVNTRSTVWLETGKPLDQYLTNVTWSPDEKYIYVAHLNRDQNHLKLIKYDALSGIRIKVLFEEKDNEYVEPNNPLIFLPNSNDKFIWNSERDGFNHLYLYNTEGEHLKQLTSGSWVVLKTFGFDKSGKNIFISSTEVSPLNEDFYSVNIESGERIRITSSPGIHKVKPNTEGNYFIDIYTNKKTPRIINIADEKSKIVKEVLNASNPISNYKLGNQKIFTINGNNNTNLYCQLTYPVDFDSTKKYPVIVYVYGGPHEQLIKNEWANGKYDFWFQKMAQNGYVVFTLDNRGSANRGLEFEQAIFGKLGTIEMEDQLLGVDYLKTKSWIDTDRIGVFGWSYGGFMTTTLMLRTNDTFKVGLAGGAVIDWKFYEVMYGERYMDTPKKNPKGYEESSLLNYVENLNCKLLLVHGTNDPTVVIQNTLEFVKKAQKLNKALDYFPYVEHGHGVKGKDTEHLYEKITQYFIDNL